MWTKWVLSEDAAMPREDTQPLRSRRERAPGRPAGHCAAGGERGLRLPASIVTSLPIAASRSRL